MKIKKDANVISFKDVPHGDVFVFNHGYYFKHLRLNPGRWNVAVNLDNGIERIFDPFTSVTHCPNATLHMNDGDES